jgi:hypothetical protein
MALLDDIVKPKTNLNDFKEITLRILNYYSEVVTESSEFSGYVLSSASSSGLTKNIRPYKKEQFILEAEKFRESYDQFIDVMKELKSGNEISENDKPIIDNTVYTVQQAMGIGFDLLGESNSSRKLVGNRFEELLRIIFSALGFSVKRNNLKIPYKTEEGIKFYRCETDMIISSKSEIKSNSQSISPDELVVSLKTTTKDRMGKIFIDKLLMEKFIKHQIKVVGISLNDIQRKSTNKISNTFVSNLFMVYSEFLAELEGYYYMDLPKIAETAPYNERIFKFSRLVTKDIWKLI